MSGIGWVFYPCAWAFGENPVMGRLAEGFGCCKDSDLYLKTSKNHPFVTPGSYFCFGLPVDLFLEKSALTSSTR